LAGVYETAQQAVATSQAILRLFEGDRKRIEALGTRAGSVLRVHALFQKHALMNIPRAQQELGLSFPTISSAIKEMMKLGMVREMSGRSRGRVFGYAPYLEILSTGI
jgi:Fic family protein